MPAYKDKQRGTWYFQINYTNIKGEYKTLKKRGFKTKKEAQDAEHLASIDLTTTTSNIKFKDLANKYSEYAKTKVKYSSYYSKENLINLHIIPFFESYSANKITTLHIQNWQKEMLTKGYSYEYLSKIYTNLSAILNYGVKNFGLRDNPCKKVGNFKKPATVTKKIQFWIYDEFNKFITVVDDIQWLTFFMFLYYMGTRKGEAMALAWEDINFKTGIVSIEKTVADKSEKGGWEITTPKNAQSIRHILMPKILQKQMEKYYEYCRKFEGLNEKSFVFGVYRPLPTTTIARNFNKYIQVANVKKVKVHDLRHSHASLLINQGASILIVSQRLGHKDVNETLNTYSHMFPSKEKEVIDLIDNLAV